MQCQSLLNSIIEISHKYGLDDFYNQVENLKKDLSISIAFLGEFSSGKSSLVNALLGKKILPAMDEPTTAAIVEVQAGEELKAFIDPLDSNEIKEIELADLGDYVFGDKKDEIGKVILEIPENDFFRKGFKFVDTPGIQSLDQTHEDITFGYLPKVDAAVFVIDINQGGATNSLINFLKEKVINEEDINKFIFVLNKADTKKPEDLPTIEDNLRKQLEEIIPSPIIISVSAKLGLEGKEEGNIEKLKEIIKENIIAKKQELVEKRFCKELKEQGANLVSILEEVKNSFDLSTYELDKEIENINQDIQKLERLKEKINKSLDEFERNLDEKVNKIAQTYAPQIMSAFIDGKEENAQNLINLMSNELKSSLTQELNKLSIILKKDLDTAQFENVNLEAMINTQIGKQLSTIKSFIESVSELMLFAILAFLSPFSTVAEAGGAVVAKATSEMAKKAALETAKKVALETAEKIFSENIENTKSDKKSSKKDTLKRIGIEFLKSMGGVIDKYNIPEKVLKVTAKKWKEKDIKRQIKIRLSEIVDSISTNIKVNIDDFLEEEVLVPLETKKQLLNKLYEERDKKISDVSLKKKEIDNDILDLKQKII